MRFFYYICAAFALAGCALPPPASDVPIINCAQTSDGLVAQFDIGGNATPENLTNIEAIGIRDVGDPFGDGAQILPDIMFSGTIATVVCPDGVKSVAFVRK